MSRSPSKVRKGSTRSIVSVSLAIRVARPPVATTRASTAQREVQELAANGYRIVATPDSPNEWVLVLERGTSPKAEYLFVQVDPRKADGLLKPATGQGYRITGMIESVVILEK